VTDTGLYADDETHPIPYLGKIDVFVAARDGRVDYGLIIASPMTGDEKSQRRLLRKIEDYLSDRHSQSLLSKYGQPNPNNTHLKIAIHPGSDAEVFRLIERCKDWIEDNGFSIDVTTDANILSLH
jgi:hypothetical protein